MITTTTTLPRTLAAELPSLTPGAPARLQGWVHRRRALAAVTFLILRDRSGLAQVVATGKARAALSRTPEETPVEVIGVVTANPQAPGGFELTEPDVRALSEPAETPPVELWRPQLNASLPTLLDHAPLSWRHLRQRAAWEVAAASLTGFRQTLGALGFTEIHSPKFVATATESGANVFAVDYFGQTAYLAQSPQFYKQQLVGAFERVYEVGPVFRAEPHDTVRHLAEYVSLDSEFGFIRDHRDVLTMLRTVLADMVATVRRDGAPALELLGVTVPDVPAEIPVLHFADALELAGASPDEPDLAPEHERALGAWALREHGSDFVAVEGYPLAKRPFYTHPWPGDARWSNSFDLIFRGTELVTGGQRLHEPSAYDAAIRARGEDPADYAGYLQAFRHGMPPHGGFAIGLERWVARLVGAANVREVTLFPRDLNRLTP
jgi:nondiscriminating aspartyl-tRNA synthetase